MQDYSSHPLAAKPSALGKEGQSEDLKSSGHPSKSVSRCPITFQNPGQTFTAAILTQKHVGEKGDSIQRCQNMFGFHV